ncbi:hypothetical protein [Sporomusa acidovorans]|uniref:Ethanolamine utilization protein n=1 Tax=Sporomusa acidovorans (strain ATCC 49682 / DSM 3132 / Mol) TaxID=1123286 RepID=A0ABZ3J835_SPOA4|nr:hypothetical protein [Sporomusa acidovorans]OZC21230.1 hypothetical protein SPACI_20820 [Sporomusa acidovorans DSM 3132]SDE65459.1 hypothetical protein SAMN04488499_101847 [Sporomusa acidovorans]
MNEDLLKQVIIRILSSPELQPLLNSTNVSQVAKPGCLILLNSQEDICHLAALTARYQQDYELGICAESQLELPYELKQIDCKQAWQHSHWQRLHIPVCSQDQLAQIALGVCTDWLTGFVSQGIIAGIPVEIGRVNWRFTAKTPEPYRQLFANYVRQAAGFGVMIADDYFTDCRPALAASGMNEPRRSVEETYGQQARSELKYDKKLLAAKEAAQLPPNGILQVAKSTIITPVAIDVLKQQKIEVYREGVRCL